MRLWRITPAFLLIAGVFLVLGASRADRERVALDERLIELRARFDVFQADPGRGIPPEILREAHGLLILRETRAGLIFGGRSGTGVLLVKGSDGWGAPAFVRSRQGSVGLQAGWQAATFFQVLMTPRAVDALRTNRFRLGVDLRVTAGPRTLGDEAKVQSPGPDVLLYADTDGVFGGLALEGGSIEPDDRSNRYYYGRTSMEVLFEQRPTPSGPAGRLADAVHRATVGGAGPGDGVTDDHR